MNGFTDSNGDEWDVDIDPAHGTAWITKEFASRPNKPESLDIPSGDIASLISLLEEARESMKAKEASR